MAKNEANLRLHGDSDDGYCDCIMGLLISSKSYIDSSAVLLLIEIISITNENDKILMSFLNRINCDNWTFIDLCFFAIINCVKVINSNFARGGQNFKTVIINMCDNLSIYCSI